MTGLKVMWFAVISTALLVGAASARATVLTFDDLPTSGVDVPNGYGGLNWTNFGYLDGVNYPNKSGFQVAAVSPNNVAFNGGGAQATVTSSGGNAFDFTGAYLTAAWNDGLSVEIQGYLNGVLEYDTTVHPSATAPTFFTFNYLNVDTLVLMSSGGTPHPGYAGPGTQVAIDNFTFTAVPEPATFALMAVSFIGIAAYRRRTM